MSFMLDQLPVEYRLGHEFIDGQHEILFQLYRELSDYCDDEQYDLELGLVLLSLKTYVATHFRYEEGLMESSGYPGLDNHLIEHRKLEDMVVEQMEKFETLSDQKELEEFAKEMKEMVLAWLKNHISKTDRLFCDSLNP
jgi:hemerythrin